MEQPLSPQNQGLNPLRGAPLWGQLVSLPAATPAIDSRVAQFAGCLVMPFGADYGPGGIGLLVLRGGDTLNLIAERYGTTVATLRRINAQLESTQTITAVEGDSLAVLAGRHGTTESKLRSLNPLLQQSEPYITTEGETLSSVAESQNLSLSLLRQFNPELSSWLSSEPLPTGTTLRLPVYRSTTPIPAGLQLLVPGYLPSTPLPAGEWIYLPARRSAPMLDESTDLTG